MRVIQLTQNQVAIVDDEDFEHLAQWRWHAKFTDSWAVKRSQYLGGGRKNSKFKMIVMADVIMPPPKGMIVDHKNGNGLDNRRCNLRFATKLQNSYNRKLRSDNAVGMKGVSVKKYPSGKIKYAAEISANKVHKWLGVFDTPEAAHEAYCAAAKELHGEFARFN